MNERIRAKQHRGGNQDGTDTEAYRRTDRGRRGILVLHEVGLLLTTEIQEPNEEGSHATKEEETKMKRTITRLLTNVSVAAFGTTFFWIVIGRGGVGF